MMPRYSFTFLGLAMLAGCTRPVVQRLPSPSPTSPAPATGARQPVAPSTATAGVLDLAGRRAGTVTFTDSYAGVLISGTLFGLGLGAHAVHIHEVGRCESPFTSAGGHFNPQHRQHGFLNERGPHLGDLPNVYLPAAGQLRFEFLLPGVTLRGANGLLDADGASIVVHSERDDYATDPSGDSGGRIACGVIVGR
jgi:Cu-Zn family superoxide dismutase